MVYGNQSNNHRECQTPYTRNATKTQFERTMKREGKIVTTYTSGTEFRAFFRTRDEHENQRETIIMYYDVTAPVRPGTLIMIGYGVFLALNRETVENDIYYKSTLIKCNGVFNENTGKIHNVPFYSDNLKSSVSIGNNTINMLNGNLELITEENSLSKQIQINQYFNEFGRTFRVTNKYIMDGIVHVIAEVEADQDTDFVNTIQVDGLSNSSIYVGSIIQLEATPYINGNAATDATFDWKSSDNSIATVDSTGKINCISEGTAKITVTWKEKDVSESINIIVLSEKDSLRPLYNYKISGNTSLKFGYTRTYILYITDENDNAIENVDFTWNVVSDFAVEQTINGNQIKLRVKDDENLIGNTFLLQVIVEKSVKAEISITIVE